MRETGIVRILASHNTMSSHSHKMPTVPAANLASSSHYRKIAPVPSAASEQDKAGSAAGKTGSSLNKPETGSLKRDDDETRSKDDKKTKPEEPPKNPFARQIWILLNHIEFTTTPAPLTKDKYNTGRVGEYIATIPVSPPLSSCRACFLP